MGTPIQVTCLMIITHSAISFNSTPAEVVPMYSREYIINDQTFPTLYTSMLSTNLYSCSETLPSNSSMLKMPKYSRVFTFVIVCRFLLYLCTIANCCHVVIVTNNTRYLVYVIYWKLKVEEVVHDIFPFILFILFSLLTLCTRGLFL